MIGVTSRPNAEIVECDSDLVQMANKNIGGVQLASMARQI